jgi:hypothetical protein
VATIRYARVRGVAPGRAAVIRVDAAWFVIEPPDVRAGSDIALARVVSVLCEALG